MKRSTSKLQSVEALKKSPPSARRACSQRRKGKEPLPLSAPRQALQKRRGRRCRVGSRRGTLSLALPQTHHEVGAGGGVVVDNNCCCCCLARLGKEGSSAPAAVVMKMMMTGQAQAIHLLRFLLPPPWHTCGDGPAQSARQSQSCAAARAATTTDGPNRATAQIGAGR